PATWTGPLRTTAIRLGRIPPMSSKPSPKGGNGRASNGRFEKGWKGGPGNPFNKQVQQLRSALLNTVTTEDMVAIVKKLIALAKKGSIPAAKELLDRVLGKATTPIELTNAEVQRRVEEMSDEELLAIAEGKDGSE